MKILFLFFTLFSGLVMAIEPNYLVSGKDDFSITIEKALANEANYIPNLRIIEADYEIRLDRNQQDKILRLLKSANKCFVGIRENADVKSILNEKKQVEGMDISKYTERLAGTVNAMTSVYFRKVRLRFEGNQSFVFDCAYWPAKGLRADSDPLKEPLVAEGLRQN